MDPISIKVSFDDLPLTIQNSIQTLFIVLCVFLITLTMCLYVYIFDYIFNKLNKTDRIILS